MRTRLPVALTAISLLAACGSTALAAPTETLSLTESHEVDKIPTSGKVKVTWTVEGTTRPVQLRIVNTDERVARVDGGNEQVVTTSGGTPNTVSVTARGLRPGNFSVKAEFADPRDREAHAPSAAGPPSGPRAPDQQSSDSERRAYDDIVRAWAPALSRIADDIDQAADSLRVRAGLVRVNDVLNILERAEDDVRETLRQPQLQPFRDAVRAFLDRVRCNVHAAASEARFGSDIVLVAAAQRKEIDRGTARSLLREVRNLFRGTAASDPLIAICVATEPVSGADVTLGPRRITRGTGVRSRSSMSLYVGLYRYKVAKPGYVAGEGEVDLLINHDRLLFFPLRRDEAEPQNVRFEPLTEDCKNEQR
jgi:hypothetical protein